MLIDLNSPRLRSPQEDRTVLGKLRNIVTLLQEHQVHMKTVIREI